MDGSQARRPKALEREHARLKRLLADAMRYNVALKDLLGKKWCRPPVDDVLMTRFFGKGMIVARDRWSVDYRRLLVLLRREGHVVNYKKLFRHYREKKLAVRRRCGRKRAMGMRSPLVKSQFPNECWALDSGSEPLTICYLVLVIGMGHSQPPSDACVTSG